MSDAPSQKTRDIVAGFIRSIRRSFPTNIPYYNLPKQINDDIVHFFYDHFKWNLDNDLKAHFEVIDDRIVNRIDSTGTWCNISFGLEITDKQCDRMDIDIRCLDRPMFIMGYIVDINKNRENVKWIDEPLGDLDNKPYSSGVYINNRTRMFVYCDKTFAMHQYRTCQYVGNCKQNDIFRLSFNFAEDKLKIYHNGNKIQDEFSLHGYKSIIPTLSLLFKNSRFEVVKCDFVRDQK